MELLHTALINDGSLQAYYRLESGEAGTDSSSNSNTLTTTPSIGEGWYGGGASGKGHINSNLGWTGPSDPFSIVAWLKRTSADSGSNGVYTEHVRTSSQLRYNSTQIIVQIGASERIQYNHSLNLDRWYHIAVTSDGSTSRLYIGGVEVDTGGAGGSTSNNQTSLGIEHDDQDPFRGRYDDWALFTKQLSVDEIQTLAQEMSGAVILDDLG